VALADSSVECEREQEAIVDALAEKLDARLRQRPIEWSDSWSEEDLADATSASMRRFDEQQQRESR
jgi:hypothetical protein